jgi:hypothetical protein
MRKFWAVFLVILVLTGSSLAAVEINLLNSGLRWTSPDSKSKLTLQENYFKIEAGSGSFKAVNQTPIETTTSDHDMLAIRARSSKPGLVELFWAARRDQFSILRNYPFYVTNNFQTNLINLAAYSRDGSVINHLLLMGPGTLEISEIKLVKSNLRQKALSGWQEFFGPLSRTQDGMEFLVIRSPRLFGLSYFYLLNLLLIVLLLIVLLFRGQKDLSRAFLLSLLVCWGIAELNGLRNNILSVQRDARYLGKTLEIKREMMNEDDLYAFIKFVDRQLPPAAAFDVSTTRGYYNFRIAYYLYPRDYSGNADFLLVYDGTIDHQIQKKYELWKTFRPGAYIYKGRS